MSVYLLKRCVYLRIQYTVLIIFYLVLLCFPFCVLLFVISFIQSLFPLLYVEFFPFLTHIFCLSSGPVGTTTSFCYEINNHIRIAAPVYILWQMWSYTETILNQLYSSAFVLPVSLDIKFLWPSYSQKCFYCTQLAETLILRGSSQWFCIAKILCTGLNTSILTILV